MRTITLIKEYISIDNADRLNAINERRATQGKATTTLAGIVYRATRASIAAISYSEKKHAASVRTVKSEDGEEADYIDTITASGADTEAAPAARRRIPAPTYMLCCPLRHGRIR